MQVIGQVQEENYRRDGRPCTHACSATKDISNNHSVQLGGPTDEEWQQVVAKACMLLSLLCLNRGWTEVAPCVLGLASQHVALRGLHRSRRHCVGIQPDTALVAVQRSGLLSLGGVAAGAGALGKEGRAGGVDHEVQSALKQCLVHCVSV